MKTTLCTLYNSLYLDKGLVVYDSLIECAKDFELYVLCMDDKCYEVLSNLDKPRLIPIKLSDFEDDRMKEAKKNRSLVSYMWTCSSVLIKYILDRYKPEICTYIDADMYFYHDPQVLVDEMVAAGKSVQIIPHRFSPSKVHVAEKAGIYCVEFNTFKNDESGRTVLNAWVEQCLENCSDHFDGKSFGDQMFMDAWPVKYPDIVNICKHPGAGLAPWNLEWYSNYNEVDHTLYFKKNGMICDVIFYHFQGIVYNSRSEVNTTILYGEPDVDYKMVDCFYIPYLRKIEIVKKLLEELYKIKTLIRLSPQSQLPSWKRWLLRFEFVRYYLKRKNPELTPYLIKF